MPGLPVKRGEQASSRPREARVKPRKFVRRTLAVRLVVTALVGALTVWLVGAALAPATAFVPRALLLVLAVLLPLHMIFFQWEGIKVLDRMRRWPRFLKAAVALLALAASPMVLYPLGLVALAVAVFSGAVAGPALAVTGIVMLAPIMAILGIGLLFMVGKRR